ncbi:MAG TPA: metal-dependent transcriptional regulator [Candidatus Krumholzibacteria bacterium]|nr:metal-dependent transcriptional regulator [Candidatus Krumholzibacteria bacterium]
MNSPLVNLIVFVLGGALAALVFWPGRGLFARGRRNRRLANRVALEDALKHVYNHEVREDACTLSSVAGALGVSSTRAVTLVDRMQRGGLLRLVDGRLLLTDDGRRYALEVVRAHRLWERYLADETGVDPVEWHERAEKEEHALSAEAANALAARLGHPRFDPHGDPIPTADGAVGAEPGVPLAELAPGQHGVLTHLEDEPPVVFAQLVAMGLYVGMEVRMDARSEQRIVFDADGRKIVLAPILASNVSVRRLQEPVVTPDEMATLAVLKPGESADVVRVSPACRGLERRRLMDLGIVAGTRVMYERPGLTGGLCAYRVRDTLIALREEQASMIGVTNIHRAGSPDRAGHKREPAQS